MATPATVPFLDPQGTPRMIPADQADAATQAGGQPAVKMFDPQGTARWIPQAQQQAALAAGGKLADAPSPAPAAPPTPPPAPAPQPATPANSWERLRSMGLKGWLQDNIQSNEAQADQEGGVHGALDRMGVGAGKGLLQLAGFGAHLLATVGDQPSNQDVIAYQQEHPGSSVDQAMQAVSGKDAKGNPTPAYRAPANRHVQQHLQETADWFKQTASTQGFWEGLGNTGEQLVELLGTGGLGELAELREAQAAGDTAKALTMSEKLKQIQGVASFMERNPRIAKLVGLGMRTAHAAAKAGTAAAAQTYIHSQGDAGEAAAAGVGGAVLGGGLEAGASAAAKLIEHVAPEVREIAGRAVPFLRSQANDVAEDGTAVRPSWIQRAAADTNDSQGVVDQQQRAAADTVREQAQGVVDRELGQANQVRAGEPSTATSNPLDPPPDPKPAASGEDTATPELGNGAPQLGNGAGTDLVRTDMLADEPGTGIPKGQPGVTDTSRPGLPQPQAFKLAPIDVKGAIARTNDFGDAADALHENAKPVYDRLNEVTGGQWQAADAKIRALQAKSWKAVGPEREAFDQQLRQARGVMDKIMSDPRTGISQESLASAKRLWNVGYKLRALHNALEPAYQVDADFARRTTEYRGFNGSRALSRFRQAIRNEPELKNILGQQGTDNLQSIFRYNTTTAGRARFGDAVGKIARWSAERVPSIALAGIGYHLGGAAGAAELGTAGEAAYGMTKFVLHKAATDPQFGQALLFAIDHARSENYVPTLGNMLLRKASPLVAGTAVQQFGGQ